MVNQSTASTKEQERRRGSSGEMLTCKNAKCDSFHVLLVLCGPASLELLLLFFWTFLSLALDRKLDLAQNSQVTFNKPPASRTGHRLKPVPEFKSPKNFLKQKGGSCDPPRVTRSSLNPGTATTAAHPSPPGNYPQEEPQALLR